MAPQPVVTGLSPKEGPPGTRVTIRGEYLGGRPSDLMGLTICGCECLLSAEWKSPNKIIARTGPGKGRGDIIVTTATGGVGTSTVQFRAYHETIGPMKESAVWVEESPLHNLAWGPRRSLAPPGYSQDDPLGLSTEGADNKFPEDDLRELFPESCGDLGSEQFSAGWFLLENHQNTSFEDLKAGLSFLRRKVQAQKEGQLSFLKANTGSVLEQLDTLVALKEKFAEDVKLYGTDPTETLEAAIKKSMTEAELLFTDVLNRRDKADATRNALGAMNRHRLLFLLPCTLQRNAQRGEYDLLVNDYARARNLFGKTEVPIFRKVLAEVDKCVDIIRVDLRDKLKEMPASVNQQKKLIRALANLDSGGDPAWDAINSRAHFLDTCLDKYSDEHIGATESDSRTKSPRVPVAAVPPKVLFCEELTECAAGQLPDLWRLGQAYFSGELQSPPDSSKPMQFKRIILNSIEKFTTSLRKALIPNLPVRHSTTSLGPWLSHCLHYVRAAFATLVALDLPSEALDIVSKLILDLRLHCLVGLFRQATEQVKALPSQETWQLSLSGEYGGGTPLPSELERIVAETLLAGRGALTAEPRELPLEGATQKEILARAQDTLLAFSSVLEELAFSRADEDVDELSPGVSQLMGPGAGWSTEADSWGSGGAPWELRLLATLANCRHTTQVVLPRIADMFVKYGYPNLPLDAIKGSLESLHGSLLETYTEHRSDPLVGTLEPSMYLGRFDWDRAPPPVGLSPYAQECLGNLLAIHAEVHRVCPWLVKDVLEQIISTVGEELARLMSCVSKFNNNGALQATIDLRALRKTLQAYSNPTTENYFSEALEAVPVPSTSDQSIGCSSGQLSSRYRVSRLKRLIT